MLDCFLGLASVWRMPTTEASLCASRGDEGLIADVFIIYASLFAKRCFTQGFAPGGKLKNDNLGSATV